MSEYTTFKNSMRQTCLQNDSGVTIFIGSKEVAESLKDDFNAYLAQIASQEAQLERLRAALEEIANWHPIHLAPNPSREEITQLQAVLYVRIREFAKQALQTGEIGEGSGGE